MKIERAMELMSMVEEKLNVKVNVEIKESYYFGYSKSEDIIKIGKYHEDEVWYNLMRKHLWREFRYKIREVREDMETFSFLHELGHYFTKDIIDENVNYNNLQFFEYRMMAPEHAADEWAVNFMREYL